LPPEQPVSANTGRDSISGMPASSPATIDPATAHAAKIFLQRIASGYPYDQAILFGSRARETLRPDSDADIAVILSGLQHERSAAAIDMARIAFDVMLDTGVLIQALPLWQVELEHPDRFSNPALIAAIQTEGVVL
jgi:predicted nucleotidyltransferase